MGKRRIGLLFNFDASWAGGVYYLSNILAALHRLPAHQQPEIILFTTDGKPPKLDGDAFTFSQVLPIKKKLTLLQRVLRKLGVLNKKFVPLYAKDIVDFLYPCTTVEDKHYFSLRLVKRIYWIPDFQHKYLKQFFSAEEIQMRDEHFTRISSTQNKLVLSSHAARHDYEQFYAGYNNDLAVLQFATILPSYQHLEIGGLKSKFGITGNYFMAPNQFWAHKNHQLIIKAIALLKAREINCTVLFTGNESDYRNPGYAGSLKEMAILLGIRDQVLFLGFIDRREQLQLMQHALAVIQPSLFEGWSTVVEDAKAMNQRVVASDLVVHREQCGEQALYFDPQKENDLANKMERVLKEEMPKPDFKYNEKIISFANQLSNL